MVGEVITVLGWQLGCTAALMLKKSPRYADDNGRLKICAS